MAKKNLLKANLKRPSLKREMKVTEEKMDEVVQKAKIVITNYHAFKRREEFEISRGTPDLVGSSKNINSGIIGQRAEMNLDHLQSMRDMTVIYHLAHRLLITKWRDQGEEPKLSFLPFIVKAVVVALREFPDLNGQLDEQAMTFTQRAQHDIGIAVSSDQGLTVPVVRGAGGRSLLDLSAEIKRLADAVREGRVAPTDLGGSSFTITSLGKDGGLFATPVINHPEVAIMGVHRMRREPRVMENDELRIRDVFNFSLSFDHRWIDGHVGAAFTYRVIRLLQRPDRLFMEG